MRPVAESNSTGFALARCKGATATGELFPPIPFHGMVDQNQEFNQKILIRSRTSVEPCFLGAFRLDEVSPHQDRSRAALIAEAQRKGRAYPVVLAGLDYP